MRVALAVVLLVLLSGGVALWYLTGVDPPVVVVTDAPPALRVDASGRGHLVVREVAPPAGAAAPEVPIFVADAETGRGIEGARLYRVHDGVVLATTDAEGNAVAVGVRLNAVVFGADGYLTEHFFDRPDLVERLAQGLHTRGRVQVTLQRDSLTVPCAFRFVDADDRPVDGVRFGLSCLDTPPPTAGSVPGARTGGARVPDEVRDAWHRHAMLSTIVQPDFNPERLHFGLQSDRETFAADPGGTASVRFVAAGSYRIEARTDALFCRREIDVPVAQGAPIVVHMRAGLMLRGRVIGALRQRPVPGALVELTRSGAIVVTAESDAEGRFAVGPLAADAMRLEIRHPAYMPFELEEVLPGGMETVYPLQPMPRFHVRGVVRRRPDGAPVPGVEVRLRSGTGVAATGTTDAAGRFDVRSHLVEPMLELRADGYLEYAELLNAHGGEVGFELLPATPAARCDAGLSALIDGRLVDDADAPVANTAVDVRPETPWQPSGIDGRRIVRGGLVPFQQRVITGPDGRFQVEWPRSEGLRLIAVRGVTKDEGTPVTVAVGNRQQIVLRAPRQAP